MYPKGGVITIPSLKAKRLRNIFHSHSSSPVISTECHLCISRHSLSVVHRRLLFHNESFYASFQSIQLLFVTTVTINAKNMTGVYSYCI